MAALPRPLWPLNEGLAAMVERTTSRNCPRLAAKNRPSRRKSLSFSSRARQHRHCSRVIENPQWLTPDQGFALAEEPAGAKWVAPQSASLKRHFTERIQPAVSLGIRRPRAFQVMIRHSRRLPLVRDHSQFAFLRSYRHVRTNRVFPVGLGVPTSTATITNSFSFRALDRLRGHVDF